MARSVPRIANAVFCHRPIGDFVNRATKPPARGIPTLSVPEADTADFRCSSAFGPRTESPEASDWSALSCCNWISNSRPARLVPMSEPLVAAALASRSLRLLR
jgi:hypothetical protein